MKYKLFLIVLLGVIHANRVAALSISDAYANSGRSVNVDQEHLNLNEKEESELEPELEPELDQEFDQEGEPEYGDDEAEAPVISSSPSPTTSTTTTTTIRPGPAKTKWNNKRPSRPHKKPITSSIGLEKIHINLSKTKGKVEHEPEISSDSGHPSPVYQPSSSTQTSSEEKSTGDAITIKEPSNEPKSETNELAADKENKEANPTDWPQDGKLTKEEAVSVDRIGQAAASNPYVNNLNNRQSFNPSGLGNQLPWGIANFKFANANNNNNNNNNNNDNYNGFPTLASKMAAFPQLSGPNFDSTSGQISNTKLSEDEPTPNGSGNSNTFGDSHTSSPYGYPPYGYNPLSGSSSSSSSSSYPSRMTSYPPPSSGNSGSSYPWGHSGSSSYGFGAPISKNYGSNPQFGGGSGYGSSSSYASPWSGSSGYKPSSSYSSMFNRNYNNQYQNPYSMYGATLNLPWGGGQSSYGSYGHNDNGAQKSGAFPNTFGNGGSNSYNSALAAQIFGRGPSAGSKDGNSSDNADATSSSGDFVTKSGIPAPTSETWPFGGYQNQYQQGGSGNSPPFGSGFNSRLGVYSGHNSNSPYDNYPFSQQSYGGGSGIGGDAFMDYLKEVASYAQNRGNPYASMMGAWGGNSGDFGGYPSYQQQQPEMPWWLSQAYNNYKR